MRLSALVAAAAAAALCLAPTWALLPWPSTRLARAGFPLLKAAFKYDAIRDGAKLVPAHIKWDMWDGSLQGASSAAALVQYEDDDLLVVYKPVAFLTQPDDREGKEGGQTDLFTACALDRPGLRLVHRLYRPTSGLVVFAKTAAAAAWLSRSFSERNAANDYVAVVNGQGFGAGEGQGAGDGDGAGAGQGGGQGGAGAGGEGGVLLAHRLLVSEGAKTVVLGHAGADAAASAAAATAPAASAAGTATAGVQKGRPKAKVSAGSASSASSGGKSVEARLRVRAVATFTADKASPAAPAPSAAASSDPAPSPDAAATAASASASDAASGAAPSQAQAQAQQQQTLVRVRLETGRKHQIRAQLAHAGHPVVGDARYGAPQRFQLRDIALHSFRLAFQHPSSKQPLVFRAGVPSSWAARFGPAVASAADALVAGS